MQVSLGGAELKGKMQLHFKKMTVLRPILAAPVRKISRVATQGVTTETSTSYRVGNIEWPKFTGRGTTTNWEYLYPPFREKAELLAQLCIQNGIKVKWSETGRTLDQQREYLDSGASKTLRSRHIIGCAIDFDPQPATKANYLRVRELAKSIGLHVLGEWDLRHVELPRNQLPRVGWNN